MADKVAEALMRGTRREGFGRNTSVRDFGAFTEGVMANKADMIAQALMAPGNALQGQYNNVEIGPDGSVTPFDPRLMAQASNMAGLVSMSSLAAPKPSGALTSGFSDWFGNSKVVDENGRPLTVYHGTDAPDFEEFKPGSWFSASPKEASGYSFAEDVVRRREASGKYVPATSPELHGKKVPYAGSLSEIPDPKLGETYATDSGVFSYLGQGKWKASTDTVPDFNTFSPDGTIKVVKGDATEEVGQIIKEYDDLVAQTWQRGDNSRVYPVHLSLQNPKPMEPFEANMLAERMGTDPKSISDKIAQLLAEGYDGIVTRSDEISINPELQRQYGGVPTQYLIFDPRQVKSATGNSGAYNPADPNILRASGLPIITEEEKRRR